ncbi:MAG: RNA polymerase sporulation sigma factor SigH [Clostridia bacterium]|nr:RNA polymerase sporulation sigma factor SigH [Clostridia bacterium]
MTETNLWQYTDDKFNKLSDEEVIKMVKAGDKSALDFIMNKYKEVVNIKVSKYFIIGAEKEDIVQEGLIGLYKAIKSYDETKENSFKTFANLCIERQLITAIKSSNRQKHMPLNSYLSLNMSAYEDEEADSVMDVFDSNLIEDPLETITKKEYYSEIENAIDKSLSDFEKKVLNRFAKGESYVQIADRLNTPVKSVDNAIQRIRKKAIRNIVEE